jgi:calcineurin-like phosphoesterase family protein
MSNVRFIGCLHLGHKSIAKYRGFEDEFEHDEHLIKNWNSVVNKRDLTYILGDITMETDKHYYQLDRLNGRKIVVLGNHDKWQYIPELLKYVDGVGGAVDYKGFLLTHVPIHPSEISFCRGNIHAHIHHKNQLEDCAVPERYGEENKTLYYTIYKYHCVDAHLINYKPISINELVK